MLKRITIEEAIRMLVDKEQFEKVYYKDNEYNTYRRVREFRWNFYHTNKTYNNGVSSESFVDKQFYIEIEDK